MPSVTGGDIIEVTFNHPVLGAGSFNPKANEDSTFDPGGFRNESDQDSVQGNGFAIYKKTRKRPMFEVLCAVDMNGNDEVNTILNALHEADQEAEWTFSHANGTVYSLTGKPAGDNQWNGNSSTFTLRVEGSGKLNKITG